VKSEDSVPDLANEDRIALEAGKGFIRMCKPVIDSISILEWKTSMGFWTVLCRCVLRRQYDALESIVQSVERGQGHSTVPLLRPACEEFLWIKFLRTIDKESRETIIAAKSQIEAADALENQASSMSGQGMTKLGFRIEFLQRMVATKAHAEQEMKTLGKKLKWNLKRGVFPSVAAIARKVDEERIYNQIYSATSRAVHFNIAELYRRAWGNKEQLTISSANMNRYWSHFCLYWGWGLFALSIHEIGDEFNKNGWPIADFASSEEMEKLIDDWAKVGPVPIIAAEEMNQHLPPGEELFS
jgi:hypothetical protein